jgi:NAD(P)-dependent dehydrogenase (short-subunit alcohol dehydrogenase family)
MAMKDVRGKTAFITGAAGGIGLGTARAFARNGANIALCDINEALLKEAQANVAQFGTKVMTFVCDVSSRDDVYQVADEVERAFGKVHIVFNNAGVAYSGPPLDETDDAIFDWTFAVNTFGPIHGFKAFAPKLKKHGEGGHLVNTSSIAGIRVSAGGNYGLYAASKFAVTALTVGMAEALEPHGIGVSVLCPAAINTKNYDTHKVRPARFGGPFERVVPPSHIRALESGMDPDFVGLQILQAIKDGDFFIFTHPEVKPWVQQWHDAIMHGIDRAAEVRKILNLPTPERVF